jgi:hypothetical protein
VRRSSRLELPSSSRVGSVGGLASTLSAQGPILTL